jgi:hypothetical protein
MGLTQTRKTQMHLLRIIYVKMDDDLLLHDVASYKYLEYYSYVPTVFSACRARRRLTRDCHCRLVLSSNLL